MPDNDQATMKRDRRNQRLRFVFLSLAVASAVFSGMVAGALLVVELDERNVHPPESAELTELKKVLEGDPENRPLKELLRRVDREQRGYLLARRARMRTGAWMLAGGLIVLIVSAHVYARLDPKPVRKRRAGEAVEEEVWLTPRRRNGLAVTGVSVVLLAALGVSAYLGGVRLGVTPTYEENWPGFRGPDGVGLAPAGEWPTRWDVESGENILWKTAVPLPGKSSPVVWGDRVFLSGATAEVQELFCFDRTSGKLLWHAPVQSPESLRWKAGDEDERVMVSAETGSAAPTPTTDGEHVYVSFNTNDVAAVDYTGKVVWVKNLGKPQSIYGLASSLLLHEGMLIYQVDQGYNADDELSALYLLDKQTGEVMWRVDRPVSRSWTSPILARSGQGVEIVTVAEPWVIAYEAKQGDELWRAEVLADGEIGASAAYADGVVYVTDDEVELSAIRTGGTGDVSKTHLLWRSIEALSDTASPVCDGRYLLQVDSGGTVTCFDAKSGNLLWKERLKGEFWSSPILAGNLMYVLDRRGRGAVIEVGEAYKRVGGGTLGEGVDATPAFGDSVIYIRGEKHLFAIGRK